MFRLTSQLGKGSFTSGMAKAADRPRSMVAVKQAAVIDDRRRIRGLCGAVGWEKLGEAECMQTALVANS